MLFGFRSNCRGFHVFLFCSILLRWFPGSAYSAVVTLDSIEIFQTHEWLTGKPTIYFNCKGEKRIDLPDVKKTHVSYTFKGEESWQPLTDFPDKKCKRCGFYEKDIIKSDEFDEWEFCPSDFTNGKYNHFKEKEFNATFLCSECGSPPFRSESDNAPKWHKEWSGKRLALVIIFSILGSILLGLILVAALKYWRKRKREQEQARFLKLFEEGDDIEDELGLGPLDGVN